MDFQEVIEPFGARLMKPEENRKVLDFYNSISMAGGKYNVITKKEPDYFRFLNYAADTSFVFGIHNDNDELEGMGALIIRPCYIDGKQDVVGHFLDLRFKRSKDRKGKGDWKGIANIILQKGKQVEVLKACRIYHGTYMTANVHAMNAIGKDRQAASADQKKKKRAERPQKTPPFLVSNLASYQAINIYARKPQKVIGLVSWKQSGIKVGVTRGGSADLEALGDFLDRQNRAKSFGYVFKGENNELDRRFRSWDNFSIESFFIARDQTGNIVGTFGVWNPDPGRQLYIDKLPDNKVFMSKLGRFAGLKVPEPNSKLDICYLTTFELDHALSPPQRQAVFSKLMDSLYKSGMPKKYHIVSFCDYQRHSLMPVVESGYMYDAAPVLLYQLHAPDGEEIYHEDQMLYPPGHEMVLM
jgi:hypothetical protein